MVLTKDQVQRERQMYQLYYILLTMQFYLVFFRSFYLLFVPGLVAPGLPWL